MKRLFIIFTFVLPLFICLPVFAENAGSDLFFSLKSSLWFQGVAAGEDKYALNLKLGEKNSAQVSVIKEERTVAELPEELVRALQKL